MSYNTEYKAPTAERTKSSRANSKNEMADNESMVSEELPTVMFPNVSDFAFVAFFEVEADSCKFTTFGTPDNTN